MTTWGKYGVPAWLWPVVFGLGSCGSRTSSVETRAIEEGKACPNGETRGTLLWQETYAPDQPFGAVQVRAVSGLGDDVLASGVMPSGGWIARLGPSHAAIWQVTVGPAPASCKATPLVDGAIFAACQVTRDCPLSVADCDTDVIHRYFDGDGRQQWESSLTAEGVIGNDRPANAVELPNRDIVVGYNLSQAGDGAASRAHLRAYDATGAVEWDRLLDLGGREVLSNVSFITLGAEPDTLYAIGEASLTPVVVKLNTDGEVIWAQRRGTQRQLVEVAAFGTGVAVVASELTDVTMSSVLELFDTRGNTVREQRFAGQRGTWATSGALATTTDDRLFVAVNDQDGDGLSGASVIEVARDGEIRWRAELEGTHSIVASLSVRGGGCSLLLSGSRWHQTDAGALLQVGVTAELGL